MNKFDAIIVLASKPDEANWQFPSHVYASLDEAAKLWREEVAPRIVLSGNYALSFDRPGVVQPFRECDRMAEYLMAAGVPDEVLIREGESKDTISNLYLIKKILIANHMNQLLFSVADFRAERLDYLCDKILGPDFQWEIRTVPCEPEEVYPNEAHTTERTRAYLAKMTPGDDSFLSDTFYTSDFYTKPW